jgi:hypothetical protein
VLETVTEQQSITVAIIVLGLGVVDLIRFHQATVTVVVVTSQRTAMYVITVVLLTVLTATPKHIYKQVTVTPLVHTIVTVINVMLRPVLVRRLFVQNYTRLV